MITQKRYISKDSLGWLLLIAILIGNAFFLNYNAFRIFNPFDMGAFLDASWRIFKGQRIYVDFISQAGPLHLYMNVLFFRLFGFGKLGIVTHMVVIHSIVITLVYWMMCRRRTPFWVTLSVTLLTVPSFYWSVSHPWRDQNAYFWGILAIALLVTQLPFKNPKTAFYTGLFCGVLAVLSLITKSNIGGAYGLMFFFVLLSSPHRVRAVGGYLVGTLLGIILALLIIRYPLEFYQQVSIYSQRISLRFKHLFVPQNWLMNYYWLPFVIVQCNCLFKWRRVKEFLVLFSGLSLVAVFSLLTGKFHEPANTFLWGIQMALAFIVMYQVKEYDQHKWQKIFHKISFGILLITTFALTGLSVKNGLELKAWYRLAGPDDSQYYPLKSEPFTGWLCHPWEGFPLDKMASYIKQNVPKNESLLNLADMYIIYALTDRDSFRGITYYFWAGGMPVPLRGKQTEEVRSNILNNLPDWVIIHINSFKFELKQLNLQNEIRAWYSPVRRFGDYILLKKD